MHDMELNPVAADAARKALGVPAEFCGCEVCLAGGSCVEAPHVSTLNELIERLPWTNIGAAIKALGLEVVRREQLDDAYTAGYVAGREDSGGAEEPMTEAEVDREIVYDNCAEGAQARGLTLQELFDEFAEHAPRAWSRSIYAGGPFEPEAEPAGQSFTEALEDAIKDRTVRVRAGDEPVTVSDVETFITAACANLESAGASRHQLYRFRKKVEGLLEGLRLEDLGDPFAVVPDQEAARRFLGRLNEEGDAVRRRIWERVVAEPRKTIEADRVAIARIEPVKVKRSELGALDPHEVAPGVYSTPGLEAAA